MATEDKKNESTSAPSTYAMVKDSVQSSVTSVQSSLSSLLSTWVTKPAHDLKEKGQNYLHSIAEIPQVKLLQDYTLALGTATMSKVQSLKDYGISLKDSASATVQSTIATGKLTVAELKTKLDTAVTQAQTALQQANTSLSAYAAAAKEKASETVHTVQDKTSETVHKVQEKAEEAKTVVSDKLHQLKEKAEHDLLVLSKAVSDVLHLEAAIKDKEGAKEGAKEEGKDK